jgi:pimeloyl-ACP methyl ester carboxylesterase
MPVLALWGGAGLVDRLPVREIWAEYADDLEAEAIPDCGHFLAEERPETVAERVLRFVTADTSVAARNAAATEQGDS